MKKKILSIILLVIILLQGCSKEIKYTPLFEENYIPKYNFTQKVPWGSDATIFFASNWIKQQTGENVYIDPSTLSVIVLFAYDDANANMTDEDVYEKCKNIAKSKEFPDGQHNGFLNKNKVKGLYCLTQNKKTETAESLANASNTFNYAFIRFSETKYMILYYDSRIDDSETYFKEFLDNILPYFSLI